MWIHEHDNWPSFVWDSNQLYAKLADVRYRQGRLLGKMETLGIPLKQEARLNTLTYDVLKSSAIEGEILNPEAVRSSVARRLGIPMVDSIPSTADVDGIVEVMYDATHQYDRPLTKERLFDWHTALFPTGRSGMRRIAVGCWRGIEAGSMQVVSGAIGREKIHFEAPGADRIEQEMDAFIIWINDKNDIDPILKAGIAHLWFVTIHPFEDGNGRIGRAIGDMMLARAESTEDRYYSMSTQIEAERKDYYTQLELQQRSSPDITTWLGWFINCLGKSIKNANIILERVLFKARLWETLSDYPVNERQRLIVNKMLEKEFEGHLNTSKYAKLTKCSADTAIRDIQELIKWGALVQNQGGGRSTSYRIMDNQSYEGLDPPPLP